MSLLTPRDNDALEINRPNANRNLTINGSDWLWACTAVYGVVFLSWLTWTLLLSRQRSTADNRGAGVSKSSRHAAAAETSLRGERIFHYLFTIAAFTGFIAYFTMASNLGNTTVQQFMNLGSTGGQTRAVFYARYIYWAVAWPLVLVAILLVSGVSWATILFAVALLDIWVLTWLFGALVASSYRWGYYAFGCFSYLVLAYILLAWGSMRSRGIGSTTRYPMLAGLLAALWIVYWIAWGLSEGSNRLSVTGEMIFYGILDLFSVPLYGVLFLIMSRRFDHASQFAFTQRGRMTGREAVFSPQTPAPATGGNDGPAAVESGV